MKVLVPRAMADGRIVDAELPTRQVLNVKKDFFARKSDVVMKLSTPFDSVLIDEQHEGILVTSFAVILRSIDASVLDMRYLATYLGTPQAMASLQALGTGTVMPLLKKGLLETFPVPLVPLHDQLQLGELFENAQKRKRDCRRIIELSDQLLENEFACVVFGDERDSAQQEG